MGHTIEKKIYYHDTDSGQVVYYANYLKYLEEGRSEYFSSRGLSLKELVDEGVCFVVARVEIDYKSPARYQDLIKVHTEVEKTSRASVCFLQRVARGDALLVEAKVILVCVDGDFKPRAIPGQVKQSLI
jgi:acyl-CoA thioester hydrolase